MKYGKTVLTVVGMMAILVTFTAQANAEIIGFPPLHMQFLHRGNGHGHGPPADLRPPRHLQQRT
jgi:hypothetical protein